MKRWLLLALWTSLGLWACSRDRDLPEPYRLLEVPSGRLGSAEARENGRTLFAAACAFCHGEKADGHGARRENFTRPPRDFTSPAWRRQTTPRRVFFAIREGVHGTPMPGWKSFSETETWDLVAYVLTAGEDHR
jgi:mono/diheme cytochrome c family protein